MALQVWLPLNGDLRNQGLSNLQFQLINSTNTTINNNGKIGKCYNNNSNTAGGIVSTTKISLGQQHSMFCWFKFTSLMSSSSLGGGLVSTHYHTTNNGTGITIKYISSTTGYLSVNTGNGSSRTYNTYCGTTLLQANTWYHGGFTYDGTNIKIYVNGNLEKTQAYANMSMPENYIGLFVWSLNSTIPYTNYKLNGFLNDVRIYNHCLSPKEIKKISQGLILHYQLNDFFPLNLVKYDKNIYTESDGSKWVRIFHHNNPASKLFSNTDTWAFGVYKDEDRWFDIYPIVQNLTTFEFMVKQKTTSAATEIKYRWIQNKNPLVATYNDVKPDAVTRITTSGYTNGNQGGLWRSGHANTHMVIANSNSGNWYGATGCWVAYQGGIPGYPNTVITTGYIDLYIKISDYISNSIYDCSGYQNNGLIKKELAIVTNSPRYNTAINFNNSQLIEADPLPVETATLSAWLNFNSIPSGYTIPLHDKNSGLAIGITGMTRLISYVGSSAGGTGSAVNVSLSTNTWYHIVVVKTGVTTREVYINGNKITSMANNNWWGGDLNKFDIGGRHISNTYKDYFNGKMVDVRAYVTALSAAAIKELYLTSLDTSSGSPKARELE